MILPPRPVPLPSSWDLPVPACFRPPPASLFRFCHSPQLTPPLSPEDLCILQPAIVCLLCGHQIKFLCSKAFFISPVPQSLSSSFVPAPPPSCAGDSPALVATAREVMAAPPESLSGRDVGFVSRASLSLPLLPALAESRASLGSRGSPPGERGGRRMPLPRRLRGRSRRGTPLPGRVGASSSHSRGARRPRGGKFPPPGAARGAPDSGGLGLALQPLPGGYSWSPRVRGNGLRTRLKFSSCPASVQRSFRRFNRRIIRVEQF